MNILSDNKELEIEVKSWLSERIKSIAQINSLWHDEKSKDIKYEQVYQYIVGERFTLIDGVDIKFIEITKYKFLARCWMDAESVGKEFVILPRHYHSNIIEGFKCEEGIMYDNLDDSICLANGLQHEYAPNVEHEPKAFKCTLLIYGYKV